MKVLKIAAIVIGAAALIATGVGLAVGASAGFAFAATAEGVAGAIGVSSTLVTGVLLAGIATLAMTVVDALVPKPSQGGSQTKWKADPYAGLPYVMGRTLVAGNIVYRRGSGGDNAYEQFVTVLSIGPIASLDTTFMNKTTVTFDGSGGENCNANGTYRNLIWQSWQSGQCPEAVAMQPRAGAAPGWTAQHKLSGLAATFLSLKYDSKDTNGLTSEPGPGWIIHGVKVYDPRLDSTYPGGSGACRAYDESTYVWSEDPHLHALTWAMGRYQNGVRVAGIGNGSFATRTQITGIDVLAFVEGANLNDARGWKIGGQIVTRPDTSWNTLKLMLQAGGATPVLVGGVISCVNRAPRVSLATITRSDIVGECTFSGTQARRSRINGVIPQYRSEAHDWELVSAAGVSVADYVALDGDERTKEIAYSLVQDVHQATQLATYDIVDAREAGPGSIPLKPWWLNYRVGDCVTFSPEDDFSIKVQMTGRSIEAQSGVVTYTVRGETDGKHAFALGQTGVAPPIVSLVYDSGVGAPLASDWSLSGVSLEANGASIPALVVTGMASNPNASSVIFDYRVLVSGQADADGWNAASVETPSITRKEFTSVTPGTQYQVGVRYKVRGAVGERLILGPVTAGQLAVARGVHLLVWQSTPYPITSTDTTIVIQQFDAAMDDGTAIIFPAHTITGLTAGTMYNVLWNLKTNAYLADVFPAATEMASSDYVFLQTFSTSSSGSYTAPPTPPGGYGGGGGNSGGGGHVQDY